MGIARARGGAGEALAAAYLELVGFEIVERNHRIAGVEVDLVAQDDRALVLVEVKFRGRTDYGGAAASLAAKQRERLLRAASVAAARGAAVRVDVVAIERVEDGAILRHFRNALAE